MSIIKIVCHLPRLGQQKDENAGIVYIKTQASIGPFLPLQKKLQFSASRQAVVLATFIVHLL